MAFVTKRKSCDHSLETIRRSEVIYLCIRVLNGVKYGMDCKNISDRCKRWVQVGLTDILPIEESVEKLDLHLPRWENKMVFKVVEKFYISLLKVEDSSVAIIYIVCIIDGHGGFYLHLTHFKIRCTFIDKFSHNSWKGFIYIHCYKKKAGVIKFFESISCRQFNMF